MVLWKDAEANKLISYQVVTVDQDGNGDFTTIKEAIEYRNTQDVNIRYVISIHPASGVNGKYVEDNPLQPIANTEFIGTGLLATVVEALNVTSNLFEVTGGNCQFRNLILQNVDATHSLIVFSGSGTNVMEYLYLTNAGTGVKVTAAGATVYLNNSLGLGSGATACRSIGVATAGNLLCSNVNGFENVTAFVADGGIVYTTACRILLGTGAAQTAMNGGLIVSASTVMLGNDKAIRVVGGGVLLGTGLFSNQSTTYDIDQADNASLVFCAGYVGQTVKFNISAPLLFHVPVPYDIDVGGLRQFRRSYSVDSTLGTDDQIVGTTAAGVTITLPTTSSGVVHAQYPIMYIVRDESGSGTCLLKATSPNKLNGVTAGQLNIPEQGGLIVYTDNTDWFTIQNDAVQYNNRNLLRYQYMMAG